MRYLRLIFLFSVLIFCLGVFSVQRAFAVGVGGGGIEPDSVITAGGIVGLDLGFNVPQGTKMYGCSLADSGCPWGGAGDDDEQYTVIGLGIYEGDGLLNSVMSCENTDESETYDLLINSANYYGQFHLFTGPIEIHCNRPINFGGDGQAIIYWLPYDTRVQATSTATTTSSDLPTYRDWIFVNIWIIFLLSFVPIGFIFSLIYKRGWFSQS